MEGMCTVQVGWLVGWSAHSLTDRERSPTSFDGPLADLHYVTSCESRKERRERAWSAWDGLLEGRLRGRPVGL